MIFPNRKMNRMNEKAKQNQNQLRTHHDVAALLRRPWDILGIDGVRIKVPFGEEVMTYGDSEGVMVPAFHEIRTEMRTFSPDRPGERTAHSTSIKVREGIDVKVQLHEHGEHPNSRTLTVDVWPRRFLPEGRLVASPEEMREIVEEVLDALREYFVTDARATDASVKVVRLDATFDIHDVARLSHVLELAATVPNRKPRSAVAATSGPAIYCGRATGRLESVTIGTRETGRLVMYDKHAQDPTVPLGTLRVELQTHRRQLEHAQIRTMADITDTSVAKLVESWGLHDIAAALERAPAQAVDELVRTLEEKRLIEFLGHLCADSLGITVSHSTNARGRYRQVKLQSGISSIDSLRTPPQRLKRPFG